MYTVFINNKMRNLTLILTPSWVSGLLITVFSLAVVGAAYFKAATTNGPLQEGFQGLQMISRAVFYPLYHAVTNTLSVNSFASNLPLLLFWAVVGAVVYLVAVRVSAGFSETAALEQTMTYTNVGRGSLIRSLAITFIIRLVTIFVWFVFWALFVKAIVPFVLSKAVVAAAETSPSSLISFLIAFGVLVVSLHAHTVFIRLIALRARLFSND